MKSTRTQFTVGLFMIVGLTVVTVAVIWLGMSHYLEKGNLYVAYFDESVQGLDRDSAVKYRGVSIGRVDRLGVAPDGRLIEAVLKIETGAKPGPDWVAQLKSVGITGLMFVEIDQRQPGDPDLSPKIDFPTDYPVIATRPSGIKQFVEGVSDVLEQLRGLDLAGISTRLKTAIDRVTVTLEDAQIKQAVDDLRAALAAFQELLANPRIERVLENAEAAGSAFRDASRRADRTLATIDRAADRLDQTAQSAGAELSAATTDLRSALTAAEAFFDDGADLARDGRRRIGNMDRQFAVTLKELRIAMDKLEQLLETLNEQPSRLIFSEPPPLRELPGEEP